MRLRPLVGGTLLRVSGPLLALLFDLGVSRREGFNLHYTQAFKATLSIPVICVGGFLTREAMEAALALGRCDIASAGRAFIADPLLSRHLRDREPAPPCGDCNASNSPLCAQPVDCSPPRVRGTTAAMLTSSERARGGTRS